MKKVNNKNKLINNIFNVPFKYLYKLIKKIQTSKKQNIFQSSVPYVGNFLFSSDSYLVSR